MFEGLGVVFAFLIAYAGLNTWARQLQGTSEYDVSRRLLKCLISIREGVWHVRARGIREGETQRAEELAEVEDRAGENRRIREIVHENRWQSVLKPLVELEATLIEAEVLWGQEFSDKFDDLRGILHYLGLNVGYYLSGIESPYVRGAYTQEHWEQIASVALDSSGMRDNPDEFQKKLNGILDPLNSLVRSKMGSVVNRGPIRDMLKNVISGRF